MYVIDNPVLQRELVVNLRTPRAFWLLLLYQVVLGGVVLIAYPREERIDVSQQSGSAQRLVDFFFLGQFVLASLMTPSFAAGSITNEKERKTYEMLLASPIRPGAIVMGKLVAALTHLVVLIIASLPIIMLCLPLGGVSIFELISAYLAILSSLFLFGAISVASSSYFQRTSSALVVSYLAILPLVILGTVGWQSLASESELRLWLTSVLPPTAALLVGGWLLWAPRRRLLYPPDVGSQASEVIDLEREGREGLGLVIQRDQFPDRLFAPPRRRTLMADGSNPIYDKELHAELFSQGTLMLRLVIQISMLLAIPLMAIFLFALSDLASWYFGYVVVFNMLAAPVFTAGSVTNERERQTLDLLLTTILTPQQMLSGKLLIGLRVSLVLTGFLLWPVLLALMLNAQVWYNLTAMAIYLLVVLSTGLVNATLGLFYSTLVRKTSAALMLTYSSLLVLYCLPVAIHYLAWSVSESPESVAWLSWLGVASPFAALAAVPLQATITALGEVEPYAGQPRLVIAFFLVQSLLLSGLLGGIVWLFRDRWRLTGHD
jgi:ABC-type transport system involved in multi-copper enzyme maturation permease subunit